MKLPKHNEGPCSTLFRMWHTSMTKATDTPNDEQTGKQSVPLPHGDTRHILPLGFIIVVPCFPSIFKLFGLVCSCETCCLMFHSQKKWHWICCVLNPSTPSAAWRFVPVLQGRHSTSELHSPPVCNTSLITSFHFEVAFLICVFSWMFSYPTLWIW